VCVQLVIPHATRMRLFSVVNSSLSNSTVFFQIIS